STGEGRRPGGQVAGLPSDFTGGVAGRTLVPWIASYTSSRWTGTSFGATIPSRTLSPRTSTTVMITSLLMTMDSFFFLDSTSIGAYLSVSPGKAIASHTRSSVPIGVESTRLHGRG